MCQNNAPNVLATHPEGYVSRCEGCGQYTVAFRNVLLVFGEDDFLFFNHVLTNRLGMWRVEDPLPHGKTWVLATPVNNLFLAFTVAEFGQLSDLLTEATLLIEARRILSQAA